MDRSNLVKNPIVSGCKLSKDEKGTKVGANMFTQVIGSIMCLIATGSDLMYGVSFISMFILCRTEQH
jgi:hypothetical protein